MDVNNKLRQIERKIEKLYRLVEPFEPVDYTEYFNVTSEMERIYKIGGFYTRSVTAVYEWAVNRGYAKTKATFRNILKDNSRIQELWIYEIQPIYIKKLTSANYYVSCDGNLLTTKKLTKVRSNPFNSQFYMVLNGESILVNMAVLVYDSFIAEYEDIEGEDIFYKDGDFGNCAVNNIQLKEEITNQ